MIVASEIDSFGNESKALNYNVTVVTGSHDGRHRIT